MSILKLTFTKLSLPLLKTDQTQQQNKTLLIMQEYLEQILLLTFCFLRNESAIHLYTSFRRCIRISLRREPSQHNAKCHHKSTRHKSGNVIFCMGTITFFSLRMFNSGYLHNFSFSQ